EGSDGALECTICISEFEEGEAALLLPCRHLFHPHCIKAWLGHDRRCPNCRFDLIAGCHHA
ncbi:hypothetical protein T492DRAFT_588999, partial [Pavlovales sp. CCMP2436]